MWDALHRLHTTVSDRSILSLFEDPERAQRFSVRVGDMLFDYSKTNIDDLSRQALLDLANARGVEDRRDAMLAGQSINETEGRAVLHTALRNLDQSVIVEGEDVSSGVVETLTRMEEFARSIRSSDITDVVNIGIGGSDLGPAMATLALTPFLDGPNCHFVSNVDGAHITDTLRNLDPKSTLIVVASKTFTTIETMTNAATAREWILAGGGSVSDNFAAVSSALGETGKWGVSAGRVFGFEDWVGGRYSVWGPIGLSLMIAIGPDNFREFLAGGAEMDAHFRQAPPAQNMPIMLALVGIWHNQVCGYRTRAVLPYDQRLARLPAYLQQLEMESNGKSVEMDGTDLSVQSGPVIWGEPGTNGQHAFFQSIHQGTQIVPCEFMVAALGHEAELAHHHQLLVANCLSQSEALMRGRSFADARAIIARSGASDADIDRMAAHRRFPGNRPSTTLIYPRLDPATLGRILALYEHRVFVEGVILGINSFDQWGVELGKELASSLGPILNGDASTDGKDGSTAALVRYVQNISRD